MNFTFDLSLDLRAEVAESPVWDAVRGLLWLADVFACRLLAFDPAGGAVTSKNFPEIVPSLGLCRSGRLLVTQRHRVLLFDPDSGACETLAEIPEHADNRLNDGKTGPDGCFWVGSMNDQRDKTASANLWRITPAGKVEHKLDGLTVANGLAWSPQGDRMYLADTRGPWIDYWDFDASTGAMSNRRRLATPAQEDGRPDGAACDAAGRYWSAGVSAGCLNVFTPEGTLERKIGFPVPAPSMPCFAGAALTELYVTSLRSGREALLPEYPTLGGLFHAQAAPAGLGVGKFAV